MKVVLLRLLQYDNKVTNHCYSADCPGSRSTLITVVLSRLLQLCQDRRDDVKAIQEALLGLGHNIHFIENAHIAAFSLTLGTEPESSLLDDMQKYHSCHRHNCDLQ